MVEIIIIFIIIIIWAVISSVRDKNYIDKLKNNLLKENFICSDHVDIPNINHSCMPFSFLIDKTKRKWALANYRALSTSIYDYLDIISYTVTLRNASNEIVKGETTVINVYDYGYHKDLSILEYVNVNTTNCEFISISIQYSENIKNSDLFSTFLMFEKQYGFINVEHTDFLSPSLSIENAKKFESMLYHIICKNQNL